MYMYCLITKQRLIACWNNSPLYLIRLYSSALCIGSDRVHVDYGHSFMASLLQESAPQTKDLSKSLPSLDSINNSRIRNASYLGAIGDLADGGKLNDVRAGIQKVLQVFIVNSANVFLLQTDEESAMSEQVVIVNQI